MNRRAAAFATCGLGLLLVSAGVAMADLDPGDLRRVEPRDGHPRVPGQFRAGYPDLIVETVNLFPVEDEATSQVLLCVEVMVYNAGTAASGPCHTMLLERPAMGPVSDAILADWHTPALPPTASLIHVVQLPLYHACDLDANVDCSLGVGLYGHVWEFAGAPPAPSAPPPGECNNHVYVPYSGNPLAP